MICLVTRFIRVIISFDVCLHYDTRTLYSIGCGQTECFYVYKTHDAPVYVENVTLSQNRNFLLQVVVESRGAAIEYGDLVVEEGSPVNPDLHFDSQLMHLYVMTERTVSCWFLLCY